MSEQPATTDRSYACTRCDWRGNDDDAETHARNTGHMRCIVCQRTFLATHQRQTCAVCVARVRLDLADLIDAYAMLTPDGVTGMTLLGDGTMQRHAHDYELAGLDATAHPLARADENAQPKPVRDEWASDPLPVVAALASWEDFWRADYGDPAAGAATLAGVVGYLTANLDTGHRAAQTHLAFDEFAAEVRRLRSTVQHAANLADVPVEAEAECFDCGGPLLRTYVPPTRPVTTPRRGRSGEGLTDDWTCGWCRRVYDQPGYFLALRAASSSWVPLTLAAETARRSVWTVRSWANRGLVTVACRVTDRTMLVWWPDVSDRAFRRAGDTQSQRSA